MMKFRIATPRRRYTFAALGVIAVSALALFQNCGSFTSTGAGVSSSMSSSNPQDPSGVSSPSTATSPSSSQNSPVTSAPVKLPPGAQSFSAGQAYSASLMPFSARGRLIADLVSYPSQPGFKAMAVAPNGYGLGGGSPTFSSQAEANRVILAQCQLLAFKPCALFAEGNLIKYNTAQFLTSFVSSVGPGGGIYDGTQVPTLLSSSFYYTSSNYLNYCSSTTPCYGNYAFKALAIGNYGKALHSSGATQAEADRRALQGCEAIDGTPCTIYAEGNTVVFNTNGMLWNSSMQALQYSPAPFAAATVPFVADADQANLASQNIAALVAAGNHVVLALSRFGHYYLGYDTTSTVAQLEGTTQSSCDAEIGADLVAYSCMIYSVDNQVVLTQLVLPTYNSPDGTW